MGAWDSEWRLIEEIEAWPIFTTMAEAPGDHLDYDMYGEVPPEEHFSLEVMSMAGAVDQVFERYMEDFHIVDIYRRNALKVAATWRPPREQD